MSLPSSVRTDDPTIIAVIAREVIRRLRDGAAQTSLPAEKLVTLATLDRYNQATEIQVTPRGIVTVAAREEAVRRGIKIQFQAGGKSQSDMKPAVANQGIASSSVSSSTSVPATESCAALAEQLARRGVVMPDGVQVVWTDQPAAEVFRRCSTGQRAVMINAFADIDRFAQELAPNVWILDRKHLNLVAATNAAVRIAGLARTVAFSISTAGASR